MVRRLWQGTGTLRRWVARRRLTAFFLIAGTLIGVGGLAVHLTLGCFVGGRFYNSGETFICPDRCNSCGCVKGHIWHTVMACFLERPR